MEPICQSPLGYHDQSSNSLDGESQACTEDSLISSANSQTTINSTCKNNCYDICKKKQRFGPSFYIVGSVLFGFLGIASVVWTPFELLMSERIKMTPSLPPFKWWNHPPDEVLLKVYIFNITNPYEFLLGNDTKLKLEEIGPIIFREKLTHTNVTFNDNGTLSYVATRKAIYLPEMNTIDLSNNVFVLNMALLGMTSYMSDMSYFMKVGFKIVTKRLDSQPFTKLSIDEYLWNFTDPLLDTGNKWAPSMVPVKNMGVLHRIYAHFTDLVTVYIGPKHGNNKFFLIDKYDGSDYLPNLSDTCKDKVVNGTEGVLYPQYITRDQPLNYYRKTMCKVTPLHYERDDEKYGIPAYRYSLPGSTFDRTHPPERDCYSGFPRLPDGLSDVSKCQYDMPMVASFPHFLHGDPSLGDFSIGLRPDEEQHGSYVIVEPFTGIPMEGKARSQSNLVIQDLRFFGSTLNKFSKSVIPLFWAEYHQVGLPGYVLALLYFQVMVLPIAQRIISAFWFLLTVIFVAKFVALKRSQGKNLLQNTQLHFEQEIFIKDKV